MSNKGIYYYQSDQVVLPKSMYEIGYSNDNLFYIRYTT